MPFLKASFALLALMTVSACGTGAPQELRLHSAQEYGDQLIIRFVGPEKLAGADSSGQMIRAHAYPCQDKYDTNGSLYPNLDHGKGNSPNIFWTQQDELKAKEWRAKVETTFGSFPSSVHDIVLPIQGIRRIYPTTMAERMIGTTRPTLEEPYNLRTSTQDLCLLLAYGSYGSFADHSNIVMVPAEMQRRALDGRKASTLP